MIVKDLPKDSDLFYITNKRHDLQPLELCVDGVETAHQVLQEHLKGLGEAQHGFALQNNKLLFNKREPHKLVRIQRFLRKSILSTFVDICIVLYKYI